MVLHHLRVWKFMQKRIWLMLLVPWLWIAQLPAAEQFALEVDGLACPFCAYGIEKRLSAIDGVQGVETELSRGRVVVTLAEGKSLTEAVARKAVEEAGFTLKGFGRMSPE